MSIKDFFTVEFFEGLSWRTKVKILSELYTDLVWFAGRDDQAAIETSKMIAILETCF